MAFPSVSIIVTVYRDEHTLVELWERTKAALEPQWPSFELILVEDGSPDGSWAVIEKLSALDKRVKGIKLSRNFGQHPAIAAGFDHARGDFIILMDGDLEDRPESLPMLLDRLSQGVDIVYTVKEGELGGLLRQVTSDLFHSLIARLSRVTVPKNVGTLRAFRRPVLEALSQYREKNVLFGPLMFHIGFVSVAIPVQRETRKERPSNYGVMHRLSLAATSLMSYTDIPHRITLGIGVLVLALSLIYILAITVQYIFMDARLPPGLTLIVLILLVFMGLTMISLGIIGAYLYRVYQEVLARPRYIAAKRLNIEPGLARDVGGETRTP